MGVKSMKFRALGVLVGVLALAAPAGAVDWIAIATRRKGSGDLCFGVGRSVFGKLVRHDIKNSRVAGSRTIYKGKARRACINWTGDKVAFLKLDGHLCVIGIDGKGFKELKKTRNHNGTAMDWPKGDWVYYSQGQPHSSGKWPEIVDTAKRTWGQRVTDQLHNQRNIRRVNVVTGKDEAVGRTGGPIWQFYMAANARKGSGRFACTGMNGDMANPGRNLNRRGLGCGTGVSPSGGYVFEIENTNRGGGHCYLRVWNWELTQRFQTFGVNEFRKTGNDTRKHFYRPRWAVNSDKWIVLTHGTDVNAAQNSNMVLYNWRDGRQVQVTDNPINGGQNDEGEDFWLDLKGAAADFGPWDNKPRAAPKPTVKKAPPPRPKLDAITLTVKLLAKSPPPTPEQMAPYSNALIIYEYEVQKVRRGTYEHKKLRVAHWGVIDLKNTSITRVRVGTRLRLLLKPFEDFPKLQGQYIKNSLPQDLDLPLYMTVLDSRRKLKR